MPPLPTDAPISPPPYARPHFTPAALRQEPRLENTLAWCRAQVEARAQHREGCAAAWARLQAEGAARRQGAEAERRAAEEAARRRAEEEARRRAEEEAARRAAEEERRRPWSCNVCTGENAASAAACAVCSCARGTPAPVVKKWTCDMCTWANAYLDEASGNKGACEQCGSRPGAGGGGGGGGGGFMRSGGGAWNCRVCSSNNDAGAQRCKVCGAENSV